MNNHDKNSIPELVDLAVRVETTADGKEAEVKVELRVHPTSLDGPHDLSCSVALKRLALNLALSGLHPIPGSRFGEPTRENVEIREGKFSSETSHEKTVSGEAGFKAHLSSPLALSSKGTGSRAVATKEGVTFSEKRQHHKVRALGNLVWEVTQPPWEDPKLDLTYLNNNTLCALTVQDRANHRTVELTAYVKQKDIVFETTKSGLNPFRSMNHRKLMNILLAKALAVEGQFNGTVIFSNSVVDLED
jgi:hypothetical protein